MYQTLLASTDQGIFTITINRPDKLNALNTTVFDELEVVVNEIISNEPKQAAINTGA